MKEIIEKETTKAKAPKAPAAAAGAARTFVPIEALRPDADQPRKVFNQVTLQELADSIREQGIIQDIIVMHVPPKYTLRSPDLTTKEWSVLDAAGKVEYSVASEATARMYAGEENLVEHYQIVDGERRWRAAKLAGLFTVPVAIRVVDEKAKLTLQVVANQQHENLTALEEAEAYKKEIESGRHTAESLYKSLGVSRGTLFSRLALNKISKPVREALIKGEIPVSIAGLVAMIPDVKKQEEFLKEARGDEWDQPMTVREAQEHLEEEYCRQLKGAPFDQEKTYEGAFKITSSDGKLSPVTLRSFGACKDCQYRTGNMDLEFKNPNVCTQPKCFEAKAETAAAETIAAAQAKGAQVLTEKQSRKVFSSYNVNEPVYNSGYTLLSEHCHEAPGGKTFKELLGKDAPEPTLALNPNGKLIPVYSKEALKAKLQEKGVKLASQGSSGSYEEQRKKILEKQKAMMVVANKALVLLIEKVKSEPIIKLLRLLALKTCFTRSYLERHGLRDDKRSDGSMKALNVHIEKLSEAELKAAIVEGEWCADMVSSWQAKFEEGFEEICHAYKVDLDKVTQTVKAEAKDQKAAKPVKPAKAKKGKK